MSNKDLLGGSTSQELNNNSLTQAPTNSSNVGGMSSLATANYDSLQSIHKSSLWEQLVEKMPEIRNAAQYYVYDFQKLSKVMMTGGGVAGGGAGGVGAVTSSSDQDGATGSPSKGGDSGSGTASGVTSITSPPTEESEVHYQPAPSVQVAINVRSAKVASLPSGERFLLMCIDNGFAVFEVKADGVFEIAVDLNVNGGAGGAVVAVKPYSRTELVVLTANTIRWYDVKTKSYSQSTQLSTAAAMNVEIMRSHAVVTTSEFSQHIILSLDKHFTERRIICADSTVIAVSPRWLAYCGTSDECTTRFQNKINATTTESVAKQFSEKLANLKAGLWGQSPALQPSQIPLGSVVVYDAEADCDVASFLAHNHTIQCLKFDGSGTLLATASTAGTTVNVFQIMTAPYTGGTSSPPNSSNGGGGLSSLSAKNNDNRANTTSSGLRVTSDVTLLYRLCRGMTTGVIVDVAFGPLSTWIAFSTAVGTCHFYDLPPEDRGLGGRSVTEGHAASQLMASCRARSAPSSVPVNPALAFLPDLTRLHGGSDVLTADLIIASTTGMVSMVRCTTGLGASLLYTKYIDGFCAAEDDASTASKGNTDKSKEKDDSNEDGGGCDLDDDTWRAHIELVSHPPHPPLKNFTIPGVPKEVHTVATAHFERRTPPSGDSGADSGDVGSGEDNASIRQTDEWDLAEAD